jgi:hypothetical protein
LRHHLQVSPNDAQAESPDSDDGGKGLGVDVHFRHNVLYYQFLPVCKELSSTAPF